MITKAQLDAHAAWIRDEPGGVRLSLLNADLRDADLSGVDLSGADLRGIDLHGDGSGAVYCQQRQQHCGNFVQARLDLDKGA